MKITAYNPSTEYLEMSYLSNSYSVGTTTIVVRNTDNFSTSDRIMIGEMGFEQTEIVTVTAASADANTLNISATLFPHATDDPVYVLKYDEIQFYRSITTVDGSYSLISQIPVDVDNDTKTTSYNDPTGLTSYFYKTSFFSTNDGLESDLSDPIQGEGYDRKQAGAIINEFLVEVGDREQTYMSVPQALNTMNECNDDLSTQSGKPYRTLKTSILLDITSGSNRIPLPDNLLALDRFKYEHIDGIEDRTDLIDIIDIEEMEYISYDNTLQQSDELSRVAIDESTNELVIYYTPLTTQAQRVRLYYWKTFSDFTGLNSVIELPTPRVYKLFLTARFYRNRALHDQSFLPLADRWASDYASEVVKLQRINRIDRGSQRGYRPDVRRAQQLRR